MPEPALILQIRPMSETTGQQRVARGATHRCRRVSIGKHHRLLREGLDVGRLERLLDWRGARHQLLAQIGTGIANAHIIRHEDQDVWLGGPLCRMCALRKKHERQCSSEATIRERCRPLSYWGNAFNLHDFIFTEILSDAFSVFQFPGDQFL